MANPQDTTLQVQAAIKNLANNTVFYFVIPIDFEVLLQQSPAPDVNSFAGQWKSLDENSEASVVIKGEYSIAFKFDPTFLFTISN